jgi:hypothetical protein
LLGLFFDYEDGGDMFLRNVGWLSTDHVALYPRRQNFSNIPVYWRQLAWSIPTCKQQ